MANITGYLACLAFGAHVPRALMIVLVLLLPIATGALAAGIADTAPARHGAIVGLLATVLSVALVIAFDASPSVITVLAWLSVATFLGWLGGWFWGRRVAL